MQLDAGQHRRRGAFIIEDVGRLVQYDLISRTGEQVHAQLVPHHARRYKHTGFEPEHRRHLLLEGVHGRIFLEYVIPHLGGHHRLKHGRRGSGNGIGAEIDHFVFLSSSS